MVTELEKSYIAGFVDGEGCIFIAKGQGRYTMSVTIAQTKRGILDWIKSNWGGSIYCYHRPGSRNKNGIFVWRINSTAAAGFLSDTELYLRGKKEQAQIALSFYAHTNHRKGVTQTPDYREWCELMRSDLACLKMPLGVSRSRA